MFKLFGRKNEGQYKFSQPVTTPCVTCDHVVARSRDILYVSDDSDGDWQFLCGEEGHEESNARIASLGEIADMDPTINQLYEMPPGYGAERRSVRDEWRPFKNHSTP